MIFDTHAHYDDQAFDEDREELLSGLSGHGVGTVVDAGAAARSLPRILQLTQQYDFLYAMAGLHPCEVYASGDNTGKPVMRFVEGTFGTAFQNALSLYDPNEIITSDWHAGEREMQLLRGALAEPKVVAVGEIGLDYHYEDTQKQVQKDWFAGQISLALEYHLPINVHSRDAAADTLDLVKSEQARDVGGVIHCFSYSKEMAAAFLDLGFHLGIGGVVTYKNAKKLKEVVSYMPMDRMVLETDCPYLAPTPHRGERNDSTFLSHVAQAIGEIKGMSAEMVIEITAKNAEKLLFSRKAV